MLPHGLVAPPHEHTPAAGIGCMGPERVTFDIGFHNGDDAAYYLSLGCRVIAVEANPALAEEGRRRFPAEVASGRLTIMNMGVWHTSRATLPFYVNDTDSGWSSFDRERGQKGGKYHTIEIPCVSMAEIFQNYGVPWYVKVDIEGADEVVVSALSPQTAPKYFSCELRHNSPAVDVLSRCGYTAFKLINQETFTQSLPIFEHEMALRALRKVSMRFPPVRAWIAGWPDGLRPKKTLWDTFRARCRYPFSTYASGPFGEETEGRWLSVEEMKRRLDHVFAQYTRAGLVENFWYDLHARRGSS